MQKYATILSLLLAATKASPLVGRGPSSTDCDCDKAPAGPDTSVKPISQPSCETVEICVEACKGNSKCQSCAFGLPPSKDAPTCLLFSVPGAHIPPQEDEIHIFDRGCTDLPTEPPSHDHPRGPPPTSNPGGGMGKGGDQQKTPKTPKVKVVTGGKPSKPEEDCDEDEKASTPPKTAGQKPETGKPQGGRPAGGAGKGAEDRDDDKQPGGPKNGQQPSGGKPSAGNENPSGNSKPSGNNQHPGNDKPSSNDQPSTGNKQPSGGAGKTNEDCDDDTKASAPHKRGASHIKPIKSRKDECSIVPRGPASSKPSPIKTHNGVASLNECISLCKKNTSCQSCQFGRQKAGEGMKCLLFTVQVASLPPPPKGANVVCSNAGC